MLLNNSEYLSVINEIKSRIHAARNRAALAVSNEVVTLYWNIGKDINEHSVWGNKFVENLARDIKLEFPNTKGYSVRNLKYMAKFAKLFSDFQIVQRLVAQLQWGCTVSLIDKVKDYEQCLWYAEQTVENGWSRDTLVEQIERNLYERQALPGKVSNYKERLPAPQSELVEKTLKDPYVFDFIDYREDMIEREIEGELVKNVTKLLLELGSGFAFVGNQYHLEIEKEDFYIDLLFYHLKLRCYVVIELKRGDFKPEYAGKLNFYISAVDDLLKTEQDKPTIGILLCKNKRGMIAEYALRDIEKPIGVSEYALFDSLPAQYADVLPSAEDIERHIDISEADDTES